MSIQQQLSVIQTGTLIPDLNFLTSQNIAPSKAYEVVRDCGEYYLIQVLYPNRENILSFTQIMKRFTEHYKEAAIPAYYCVDNGSISSWFVVFLKKGLVAGDKP